MTAKIITVLGALLGAISVIIGAFGAHALKGILESNGRLDTFETGVRYQFYHALALFLVGILAQRQDLKLAGVAWFFIAGILVFSVSLYILSLTGIKWLGAITPFGGLCMIIGWLWLGWILFKKF